MEREIALGGPDGTPRPRLDRDRILDAAEAIATTEGVGKVTLRRIGAELGADHTAVYRHFRSKDELLIELADRLFGNPPEVDPALPPRDQLLALLRHAMRRYRTHPDLAMLLAVQPEDTPSLQRIADLMLGRLLDLGLSPRDAARMYEVVVNHVAGVGLYYALVEHSDDHRDTDAGRMRRAYALLPPTEYPSIAVTAGHLFGDPGELFDLGSEAIIDMIERLARQQNPTPDDEGAPTT